MKKSRICITLTALVQLLFGCGKVAYDSKVPEPGYSADNEYMKLAIDEAREGIYRTGLQS